MTDHTAIQRLLELDRVLSSRVSVPSGPLRLLALLVAHSGDSLLWLASAVAALVWGNHGWQAWGSRVLVATLVGGAIAATLKFLFRRGRPGGRSLGLYIPMDRHAFPSGHATRAACLVLFLAPLLPAWGIAAMAAWAVAVSLARVALQIHYFLDVLVGLLLGVLIGLLLSATL